MLNEQEQFVWNDIDEDGGFDMIDKCIPLLEGYLNGNYYESKNNRLNTLKKDIILNDLYEWTIAVWTTVMLNPNITYQAICGKLNGRIPIDNTIDRVKTTAEIIAVVAHSGLIDIVRHGSGKHITLSTPYELDKDIPAIDKHVIQKHKPQPVKSNWDHERRSMILGNALNHHEEEIRLDHLNAMNAIPLSLNKKFLSENRETTDKNQETVKQQEQWDQHVKDSLSKYAQVFAEGNKFYLEYKYCTRGRTYDDGYHVSSQGTSYKKASIQLWKKEMVW